MSSPEGIHRGLSARLRRVESRNLTYVRGDFPIYWSRARGSEVWDEEGRRYIDFSSAFGVASVGHSRPEIAEAVAAQAARLPHGMGDLHPTALKVELLERLSSLFPMEVRSILSLSGTEAVESALKTCMLATGRPGVLAFEGAYHGLGYGALGTTWRPDFREPFRAQLGLPVVHAPFPTHDSVVALGACEEALRTGRIGAVLIEPIQGRGGIRVPPPGFLPALAALARRHGALLVLDEVMTGFGRTGRRFAFEHEGVVPDLVAVGKALGGGVPISACVGRAEIMDAWPESGGDAIHTMTFLGHPLGCRAALVVLDLLESEHLAEAAARKGARAIERVRAWCARGVSDAGGGAAAAGGAEADGAAGFGPRGRGLMIGIPCGSSAQALRVAGRALKDGLIVLVDGADHDVIALLPPLSIPEALLDEGLAILERAFEETA
jgi:4-aminobutyrate aminotransferase/(S)-3-amino-2-methylpropionate transaminase